MLIFYTIIFTLALEVICNDLLIDDKTFIPNLPLSHYPHFFKSNTELYREVCLSPKNLVPRVQKICTYVNKTGLKCWGYEDEFGHNCQGLTKRITVCEGSSQGWTKSNTEQKQMFYDQGDFGYIRERIRELKTFCAPKNSPIETNSAESSKLECTKYFRFCRAKNLLIDFSNLLNISEPVKYRTDILYDGLIRGWDCDLNREALLAENRHKSPLQSWYDELEHFSVSQERSKCDIVLNKPTFIMKLDATVNMYHHFCDFINLYASLHINNSFNSDNNILIWDTMAYRSNFGITWKAFTKNPVLNLEPYKGKKVCFKNVVFPLLPRMVFGLYYNMPLVPGCRKSSLFHAFNRHIMHKLRINQELQSHNDLIRVTLISRLTKYRRIVNEDELLMKLEKASSNYLVRRAEFSHQMSFKEQIEISQNTDILVGMHGAGLTHCLFQPDWGVLFELYNCEDPNCYRDLAHLRGLKYATWKRKDLVYPEDSEKRESGAHQKFTNYRFDPDEFVKIIQESVDHVRKSRKKFFENNSNQNSVDIEAKSQPTHSEL